MPLAVLASHFVPDASATTSTPLEVDAWLFQRGSPKLNIQSNWAELTLVMVGGGYSKMGKRRNGHLYSNVMLDHSLHTIVPLLWRASQRDPDHCYQPCAP